MIEPLFVAQFEPPETTEERIANRANEDSNLPEWNWCGICCLRMILLGLNKDAPSLLEMYQKAFDQYGVFRMIEDRVIGAYHRELAQYARIEFGFFTKCIRGQSTTDIAQLVTSGSFVIASVSPEIRTLAGAKPEHRSGHLVLVYGIHEDNNDRAFLIHNSAGFLSLGTQSAVLIPEDRFNACFSGNGIIIADGQ